MGAKKDIRRTYYKPRIKRVNLIVEEAVLQACKVASERAPGNRRCNHPSQACLSPGS